VPLSCIEPQSLAQNRRTFGIKIPPRSERPSDQRRWRPERWPARLVTGRRAL